MIVFTIVGFIDNAIITPTLCILNILILIKKSSFVCLIIFHLFNTKYNLFSNYKLTILIEMPHYYSKETYQNILIYYYNKYFNFNKYLK